LNWQSIDGQEHAKTHSVDSSKVRLAVNVNKMLWHAAIQAYDCGTC